MVWSWWTACDVNKGMSFFDDLGKRIKILKITWFWDLIQPQILFGQTIRSWIFQAFCILLPSTHPAKQLFLHSLHLFLPHGQNSLHIYSGWGTNDMLKLDRSPEVTIISSLHDPNDVAHPTPTPQFKWTNPFLIRLGEWPSFSSISGYGMISAEIRQVFVAFVMPLSTLSYPINHINHSWLGHCQTSPDLCRTSTAGSNQWPKEVKLGDVLNFCTINQEVLYVAVTTNFHNLGLTDMQSQARTSLSAVTLSSRSSDQIHFWHGG